MLEEIAALVKKERATSVDKDLAFDRRLTKHAQRFWRQHRMLYCKRVFASPEQPADSPWKVPQWIGTAETNTPYCEQYPLRGFYLPNDDEAMQYYANRRSEQQDPAWTQVSQFKAKGIPGAPSSPLNIPARSKMGAVMSGMSGSTSRDSLWSSWSTQVRREGSQSSLHEC